MRPIVSIIVDDEHLARKGLALRMQHYEDFSLVAQCRDGKEAIDAIEAHSPDVIFIDIEMPGMTGLDVIKAIHQPQQQWPKVVFVTAYKEFALEAFERHAFDYLLKPFTDARLDQCLIGLREAFVAQFALNQQAELSRLLTRKTGNTLDGFMQSLMTSNGSSVQEVQHTISLKSGSEWLRIRLDSIEWIEAAGDYMCLYTKQGNHIVRKTLKEFEQELDPARFARVNRSSIVNLNSVTKLTPNSNGEYVATLGCGATVKVGRKYKLRIHELQ